MTHKCLDIVVLASLLICLIGVASACSSPTPPPTPTPTATAEPRITPLAAATATSAAPTADGKTLTETYCVTCHPLTRATSAHKTRDQWEQTINRMVHLGAADQATVLDYLVKNYGP